MAVFDIAEALVRGLIGGLGPMGAVDHLMTRFHYEWLSRALVIFFAFIPFFAVRELRRVLGEGAIAIFFRRRSAAEADSDPPLKTYLTITAARGPGTQISWKLLPRSAAH